MDSTLGLFFFNKQIILLCRFFGMYMALDTDLIH